MSEPMTEARVREIIREEIKAAQPCTCQYGNDPPNFTPRWYASVRTCARHSDLYDANLAPAWAP